MQLVRNIFPTQVLHKISSIVSIFFAKPFCERMPARPNAFVSLSRKDHVLEWVGVKPELRCFCQIRTHSEPGEEGALE
jgi:hypothetical protein